MNLLDIRTWFAKDSGRYDLVDSSFADNGADKYINAGQRWLDRQTEHAKEITRFFRTISSGDYFVRFQDSRVITNVWCGDTSKLDPLERKTYNELRGNYDGPFSGETAATPKYFCPAWLRIPESDEDDDMDGYLGYMDVMTGWKTYNGIIIMPPANGDFHVEVWAKAFSRTLVSDTDESFWSVNEPHVLVMAGLRALEVFYRNTQGVNDWTTAINAELFGLGKDFVEEFSDYDQMEG